MSDLEARLSIPLAASMLIAAEAGIARHCSPCAVIGSPGLVFVVLALFVVALSAPGN